jgi:hypothetical protein
MSTIDIIRKSMSDMTEDEYFAMSEDRKAITPENIGGLCDYPRLFRAMQDDRELRPELTESMYSGRAMNDFLTVTPEEFTKRYVVSDGPLNPKTGKPYLYGSKAYAEWRATLDHSPVSTEQFAMFGRMASAYNEHRFILDLSSGHELIRNAIIVTKVQDVDVACKIDNLFVREDSVFAVDVKTCDDLSLVPSAATRLHYREQQALILRALRSAGVVGPNVQVRIAAIEKGKLPRCGIFAVQDMDKYDYAVCETLGDYALSLKSGVFRTMYEAPVTL